MAAFVRMDNTIIHGAYEGVLAYSGCETLPDRSLGVLSCSYVGLNCISGALQWPLSSILMSVVGCI